VEIRWRVRQFSLWGIMIQTCPWGNLVMILINHVNGWGQILRCRCRNTQSFNCGKVRKNVKGTGPVQCGKL
jgi:hypothetical protein